MSTWVTSGLDTEKDSPDCSWRPKSAEISKKTEGIARPRLELVLGVGLGAVSADLSTMPRTSVLKMTGRYSVFAN